LPYDAFVMLVAPACRALSPLPVIFNMNSVSNSSDSEINSGMSCAEVNVSASLASVLALSLIISLLPYEGIDLTGALPPTAIVVVLWLVPLVPLINAKRVVWSEILRNGELMRLNYGMFALHITQMASFMLLSPCYFSCNYDCC